MNYRISFDTVQQTDTGQYLCTQTTHTSWHTGGKLLSRCRSCSYVAAVRSGNVEDEISTDGLRERRKAEIAKPLLVVANLDHALGSCGQKWP